MSFNDLSKGAKTPAQKTSGDKTKMASGARAPSARPEVKPIPAKSGAKS